MKRSLNDVTNKIKSHSQELKSKFQVSEIYLFGSALRDQMTDESDIDLLVEFEPGAHATIFDLISLSEFLEALLEAKIDLGTKNSLHPALKEQILKEALRVA